MAFAASSKRMRRQLVWPSRLTTQHGGPRNEWFHSAFTGKMKWLPPRAVRTPVKNADKDAARPSGHLGMRQPLRGGRAGRYGFLIALVLAIAYPTAILVYLAFWSGQPGRPGHLTLQWFLEAFGGAAFD